MTTIITPVPVIQHIPTCPDCRQELPDYDAEYCGTCKQEICEDSSETWMDIFLVFLTIITVIALCLLLIFPILSWIAEENTTLVTEFVEMFKAIFTKLKTIW